MWEWIQLFKKGEKIVVLYNLKTGKVIDFYHGFSKVSTSITLLVFTIVILITNLLGNIKINNILLPISLCYFLSPLIGFGYMKLTEKRYEDVFKLYESYDLNIYEIKKHMDDIDKTTEGINVIIFMGIIGILGSLFTLYSMNVSQLCIVFILLCIIWYFIFSLQIIKRKKIVKQLKRQIRELEVNR